MEAPLVRPGAATALALLLLLLPAAAAQVPPLPVPAPPAPSTPLYAYHTYESLQADLHALAQAYPDHARVQSLGQSVLGRELWMIEIGTFTPGYDERPGFYLDGGHHGNEHLGIEAAFLFARQLLEDYDRDPATAALVDAHRIYVTPLVNPDGKAANTRQNANLVNLNRNYPFHWNERGTDPEVGGDNYAGPGAASEPETQATMAFLESHDLRVYVSLHTGSYDIVRPFGHAPDEPVPDEDVYQRFFTWAEEATGLESRYPGGSGESICWAYGAQGVFSVLFEVYEHDVRPDGAPQLLPGPAEAAAVQAVLEPHLAAFRHLLENTARWGAHVEASLMDVRGQEGTLLLRNDGFAAARNLTVAGTGLDLLGAPPTDLAPGAEARLPVRLDGPSQALVRYERLRVQPEDASTVLGAGEAVVEFRTSGIEPAATPGPEVALLVLALAGAAWRRRR